jgi:CBS domain-containing protein
MTDQVHTCSDSDTVDQLMATMTERRVRHVPVVSNEVVIGIVSIGDVVKSRLDELEAEARTLHDYIELGR